jgi:hypothetical protein
MDYVAPSIDSAPRAVSAVAGRTDLEQLGERIAELAAQLAAATCEMLSMIREFDARSGWDHGFRSCAHWLSWRTGLDLGAAREKVRVARALGELPVLESAMRRGEVSFSKVRALTRIATPANEAELLIFARAGTASHVERLVRACRRVDADADLDLERRRHEGRFVRVWTDEDGMVTFSARLTPEAGAVLQRALDAAGDALHGVRALGPAAPGDATAEQRRADALGLVAESALAGGLDPGTRGDRYQVVLHVDAEALRREATRPGDDVSAETPRASHDLRCVSAGTSSQDLPHEGLPSATTLDGRHVSAETCRRIACDCSLVALVASADGSTLDVGRRRRTISPALRRALERRDGGCRFPGCGLRICDAHHVEHWADGGETSLDNTLLLCRRHHRAVHEEGFEVERLGGGAHRFYRPDGRLLPDVPGAPLLPACGAVPLAVRLGHAGIEVDVEGTIPSWDGRPIDLSMSIDWLGAIARREAPAAS